MICSKINEIGQYDRTVNQLIAYTTLPTIFKTLRNGESEYLAERLRGGQRQQGDDGVRVHRREQDIRIDSHLSVSRQGFMYRGGKLWNLLPESLKTEPRVACFKNNVKKWVRKNITAMPQATKHSSHQPNIIILRVLFLE